MDNNIKDIVKRLGILEERVLVLEHQTKSISLGKRGAIKPKKLSLREFLIAKMPSDDVKRALVIGYYFEKFDGFISFNSDDLRAGYENAKGKKPLNINDKVNMNIKNGHMTEASAKKDNKKAWYVTNSGERFVESDFKA